MSVVIGKVHTTDKCDHQQRNTSMSSDNDKPGMVDRAYVRAYLAKLTETAYAKCRGKGHAFPDKGKNSSPDPQDNSVVERVVKCRRCKVVRTEVMHLNHEERTAYLFSVKLSEYPEDYLMERGHGRLDSDAYAAIRYENLRNEMQQLAGGR